MKINNSKLRFLGLLIIALSLLNSCSKSPKCWGDDKNKGEIISHVSFTDCEELWETHEVEFIITNQEELDSITNCITNELEIDFSKQSLIGYRTEAGGCTSKIIRDVTIDYDEKTYDYEISVKSCGLCKCMMLNYNFVIVPAIPNNYSVRFDVDIN